MSSAPPAAPEPQSGARPTAPTPSPTPAPTPALPRQRTRTEPVPGATEQPGWVPLSPARRAGLLEALLAGGRSLIHVKDLQGRYLLANPALQAALGRSESELLGHDDQEVSPEHAAQWQTHDRQAEHGSILVEELTGPAEDRHHVHSLKFPLRDGDGTLYATAGISVDTTELNQALTRVEELAAEQARLSRAALAAAEARTRFLAAMGHEIRTPLNAVIGMSDLLLTTEMDLRQTEYMTTVRTSANALLQIVNDILDYARYDGVPPGLDLHDFTLDDLLDSCLTMTGIQAAPGVELIADVAPDLPNHLHGDGDKIHKILVNLLSNALKFTHHGEVVLTVRADHRPNEDATAAPDRTPLPGDALTLTFSVQDSGIGMTAEQLDRLFEPFVQADLSTTRRYGGSGLGLTISQALARALGGPITVTSEPGAGTTFSFSVPLRTRPQDRSEAEEPEPAAPLSGRRILVVDDNATNLQIIRRHLEQAGADVLAVADPLEALTLMTQQPQNDDLRPDALLIDHEMPALDGITLAERLHGLSGFADVPVVLLHSCTALPGAARDLFTAVHLKPVRPQILRALLTDLLSDSSSQRRAAVSPPVREDPATGGHSPLRVLLVEDNLMNQKVTQGMLNTLGHDSDLAENGHQALHSLQRRAYDVVLMDVHMPQMDGLTATRMARAGLPPDRQPHIIAMTASALPEDRQACEEAGMNAFLLKPARIADLSALLSTVPFESTILGRTGTNQGPPRPQDILDSQVLTELIEEMGLETADLRRRFIDTFTRETDDLVARMDQAATENDAAAVRGVCHTLSANAALIGAQDLVTKITTAGALARVGSTPEALRQACTDVGNAAALLHKSIETYLEDPGPAAAARP